MVTKLDFSAQVSDIVKRCEIRMDALVKQSVQDLIDDAQTPVAKGGRMRVDTGFLRASGQLSFTGMPSGPNRPEDGATGFQWSENISVSLAGYKSGDTIYFGWTAEYAGVREFYDGFLAGAVQNWQKIVDRNAKALIE